MRSVAVIFGGPSLEHEISVLSGRRVLEGMDRSRYRPLPVLIERDCAWVVDGVRHKGPLEGAAALRHAGCDVAFLALHGPFGEDGTIQGFLKTLKLPFTGSGVAGSALARDKIRAKRYLETQGLLGAPDLTVPPATAEDVRRKLGFPVLVKNPFQGSTLGLELAKDAATLEAAVGRLREGCSQLLVERQELGRELTAPVLDDENGEPEALPLVEIRVPDGFFDYQAKYSEGGAEEIVPAPLDEGVAQSVRACGVQAHRALGLRGMSRSDFILRSDGELVFLETNSIPGLTERSLLPQAAAAAGIDFTALISRLVESALR
ncbi:MAG: D-alanine--D-alanine ligase family protein [Planctomycetota bacterium]|jgi:D-alanine-D-alanine ligase